MNKEKFDSLMVKRVWLTCNSETIVEAQDYFNSFVKKRASEWLSWLFCIHRCMMIAIFWHNNTKEISYDKEKYWLLDGEKIKMESVNIRGNNWRDYVVIIHDNDSLPMWVSQNDRMKRVWSEKFQKEWVKILQKIRKIWILSLITQNHTHEKLGEILDSLSTQERDDMWEKLQLIQIKKESPTRQI